MPVAPAMPVKTFVTIAASKGLEILQSDVLKKALYGTVEARRLWYYTFKDQVAKLGWHPSPADPCISIKGNDMLLLLYVDDMLLAGLTQALISDEMRLLATTFKLQMGGNALVFLGSTNCKAGTWTPRTCSEASQLDPPPRSSGTALCFPNIAQPASYYDRKTSPRPNTRLSPPTQVLVVAGGGNE